MTERVEWEICVEQAGGDKKAALAWDQSQEPGVTGIRAPTGSALPPDPAEKLVSSLPSGDGGPSTT